MKLKDGEGGKTIENFEKLYSLIRPVNIRLYKPKREKRTTISRLKTVGGSPTGGCSTSQQQVRLEQFLFPELTEEGGLGGPIPSEGAGKGG